MDAAKQMQLFNQISNSYRYVTIVVDKIVAEHFVIQPLCPILDLDSVSNASLCVKRIIACALQRSENYEIQANFTKILEISRRIKKKKKTNGR